MKERIWFKAKNYGYGWYPATWQGWLILLIYSLFFALNVLRIVYYPELTNLLVWYLPETFIETAALIFICYLTGEKPEWRWGNTSTKTKKKS